MKTKFLCLLCILFSTTLFAQQNPMNEWQWVQPTISTKAIPSERLLGIAMVTITDKDDSFVIGESTQSSVAQVQVKPFEMNKFETSYQLWYRIRLQAEDLGYQFDNPGQEGSGGRRGKAPTENGKLQPVVNINWRDAVVWCNALSEIENLQPCYTYKGAVVKNSAEAAVVDLVQCNYSANGYRLPSEIEWEYAARKTVLGVQRGDLPSGSTDKNGNSDDSINETTYSWTSINTNKSHEIATAGEANGCGIFDMTGNALEYCFDWFAPYNNFGSPEFGSERVCRGGSWSMYTPFILAGDRYSYDPSEAYDYMGFRICRSKL